MLQRVRPVPEGVVVQVVVDERLVRVVLGVVFGVGCLLSVPQGRGNVVPVVVVVLAFPMAQLQR